MNSLVLNSSTSVLFSAGRDATIRLWELSDTLNHVKSLEHHTDWVNDIVLTTDNNTIVSCSSDTTVKVWNSAAGKCVQTLKGHRDYVMRLAYARFSPSQIISAGLDTAVHVWDLERALALSSSHVTSGASCLQTILSGGHKGSIYSLASNARGTLIASGSSDSSIRLWDPRGSGKKMHKLVGHSDMVRCLVINPQGSHLLSSSSDASIKLWDLRASTSPAASGGRLHCCVKTFEVHADSVWTLAPLTPSFDKLLSSGRDGHVILTDTATDQSTVVCSTTVPVLKLLPHHNGQAFTSAAAISSYAIPSSVWIATTQPQIQQWPLPQEDGFSLLPAAAPSGVLIETKDSSAAGAPSSQDQLPTSACTYKQQQLAHLLQPPLYDAPLLVTDGRPGIIKHKILNNRRQILTQDDAGQVKLWDITTASLHHDYGQSDLEEVAKTLFEELDIPTFFSVDTTTGSIAIHLPYPQCFSAEVYAVDAAMSGPHANEDVRVNLGERILSALFRFWVKSRSNLPSDSCKSCPAASAPSSTALASSSSFAPPNSPSMHSSVNLQQDGAPNATADKNPTESTSGDSANTKAVGQEAKEASDETSTSSSESPPAETSTQSTANKDRGSGSNVSLLSNLFSLVSGPLQKVIIMQFSIECPRPLSPFPLFKPTRYFLQALIQFRTMNNSNTD